MYKMHHPKAKIEYICENLKSTKRPDTHRADVQAETFDIAECLNTICKEARFVNIIQRQYMNQPNMHSTN
jgi:hypothetical protein